LTVKVIREINAPILEHLFCGFSIAGAEEQGSPRTFMTQIFTAAPKKQTASCRYGDASMCANERGAA